MIITCPDSFANYNDKWKVFLAGPIQGAPKWQFDLPDIEGVVWISPRRKDYDLNDTTHSQQMQWETDALRAANIVLFWIPKEVEDIPGRAYAQTTRFELGENIARGKRIILGTYEDFPSRPYFEYKVTKYSNVIGGKVHNSLDECIETLKNYIDEHKSYNTYFTSDTHFSSERALKLSTRPFANIEEMDWRMIENWNNVVNPNDYVYHLGDFGDEWPLQYLSGKITLIDGNYEHEGKYNINSALVHNHSKDYEIIAYDINLNGSFILIHEPVKCKEIIDKHNGELFGLYGHIHGRQWIKKFGIDVGVDCNNFTPVSAEKVNFYRNAVEKNMYDENVWIQ